MSVFTHFAERRSSWRGPGSDSVAVLLRTDEDAVFGVGMSRGGKVSAALIAEHLRVLLLGQDALEVGRRMQEMQRAIDPYAAGGIAYGPSGFAGAGSRSRDAGRGSRHPWPRWCG